MTIGPFQILIIALVLLVLFGRGRISDMLGDIGKGVKSFRRNLEEDAVRPVASIDGPGDATEGAVEPIPARDQTHN